MHTLTTLLSEVASLLMAVAYTPGNRLAAAD